MHQCLSRNEIQNYLLGRLSEVEWERVGAEIDDCPSCQAVASEVDDQDSFAEMWSDGHAVEQAEGARSAASPVAASPVTASPVTAPSVAGSSVAASPDVYEREPQCHWAVSRLTRVNEPSHVADRSLPTELGAYQIVSVIGQGGMGMVYRAVHVKLKRTVALKVLSSRCQPTAAQVARFEREMEAVGKLDHPNIIRASDAGERDGVHFLVTEYVDGIDLAEIVRRLGPLSVADACEVARQSATALQVVYEHGLVHRDVKPSNLMVTRQGEVKLLDLGLAMLDQHHANYDCELTSVGQFMGTLDYISPEQGSDSRDVDTRADIYSLGATLYKLLTGVAPYDSHELKSPIKKITALATLDVPRIDTRRSDLPEELIAAIHRMLARSPQARFHTPDAVAETLTPFCAGADLTTLLDRAERMPVRRSAPVPGSLTPATPDASKTESSFGERGGSRGWRSWLAGMAAGMLLIFTGILIYVQTNRGTLVIECDEPGVDVAILSNDQPVRGWRLEPGVNETSLFAGQYEIKIKGPTGGLKVVDGKVAIMRGGKEVVRIHENRKQGRPTSSKGRDPYAADGMAGAMNPYGAEGGNQPADPFGGGANTDMHDPFGDDNQKPAGRKTDPFGDAAEDLGDPFADDSSASDRNDPFGGNPDDGLPGGGNDPFGPSGDDAPGAGGGDPVGPGGDDFIDSAGRTAPGSTPGIGNLEGIPTYDGKTLTAWLSEMKYERKPERLMDAVGAMIALGEDLGEERSMAVLLQLARRYDFYVIGSSPVDKLKQLVEKQIQQAMVRGDQRGLAIVYRELRHGKTNSQLLLVKIIANPYSGIDTEKLGPLFDSVLRLLAHEDARVRSLAISAAAILQPDAKKLDTALWQLVERETNPLPFHAALERLTSKMPRDAQGHFKGPDAARLLKAIDRALAQASRPQAQNYFSQNHFFDRFTTINTALNYLKSFPIHDVVPLRKRLVQVVQAGVRSADDPMYRGTYGGGLGAGGGMDGFGGGDDEREWAGTDETGGGGGGAGLDEGAGYGDDFDAGGDEDAGSRPDAGGGGVGVGAGGGDAAGLAGGGGRGGLGGGGGLDAGLGGGGGLGGPGAGPGLGGPGAGGLGGYGGGGMEEGMAGGYGQPLNEPDRAAGRALFLLLQMGRNAADVADDIRKLRGQMRHKSVQRLADRFLNAATPRFRKKPSRRRGEVDSGQRKS